MSQLLGLLGILDDESVEVTLAADLELDDLGSLGLLYAGSCFAVSLCVPPNFSIPLSKFPLLLPPSSPLSSRTYSGVNVHEASLRLAISMNYFPSVFFLPNCDCAALRMRKS